MTRPRKEFFVKLQPVLEIIRAALWTGKIGNERPVSVMLIAQQESAKTEVLKFFDGTPTIRYLSDLTSKGINPYKADITAGKIRHLVILDLVRLVSHGRATSQRTLQTLASLMEEGESNTSDAGGLTEWGKFPKVGALMGITQAYFNSSKGGWRKTGFLTRFIPVCYHYNDETVNAVHESISNGHTFTEPRPEKIPEFEYAVDIRPTHATLIMQQAKIIGLGVGTYGFRYHRVLRTLAKASARMDGRGVVQNKDVDKIIEWSKFFTLNEVEL